MFFLGLTINETRIHKLQKKAVRAITSSSSNAQMESLFKRLNILKISDAFDKQCLKFYHKFCNDMLPVFFNSMYVKQSHIYQHDTDREMKFAILPPG